MQDGNIHNLYSSQNPFMEVGKAYSTFARGGKPTNNFRKKNETTQLDMDERLLNGS
jgi:hypothetical protein